VRQVLGGLPQPARVLEGQRLPPPERLVHGGLLLGGRGRHRPPALRRRDGRAAAGGLGALACLGPGANGAAPCRRAAWPQGHLHRRGQARPILSRSRRRGVPGRAREDRRHRRLLRALRRDALGDRVPLPARGQVPRGTTRVIAAAGVAAAALICLGPGRGTPPAIGRHRGWTDDIYGRSLRAGRAVQKAVVAATGALDRGIVRRSDLTGFNWANVPAVLVETGFLSNPNDSRLLHTPSYRQRVARGLANGVSAFVGLPR